MSKQPYIPLYIGDWEQDTNTLSLEAEAGWLKIIFKMFKNGKTGIYKTSTKALQNLWRKSPQEIFEIINELKVENVCFIEVLNEEITFKNRRMEREFAISKVRTKAVQTRYKTNTNNVHPLEYDIDNEVEIEFKDSEDKIKLPKNGFFSDSLEKKTMLSEIQVGATIEFIWLKCKKKITETDVAEHWEAFKINQFSQHEWYNGFEKLLSHFRNSFKKEIQNNGSTTHKQSASGAKLGTSEARTEALRKW